MYSLRVDRWARAPTETLKNNGVFLRRGTELSFISRKVKVLNVRNLKWNSVIFKPNSRVLGASFIVFLCTILLKNVPKKKRFYPTRVFDQHWERTVKF